MKTIFMGQADGMDGNEKRGVFERLRGAYRILAAHRYSTIAGTLVFFLVLSLFPFLFWLSLLFGNAALDVPLHDLGLFGWAEDLFVLLREGARQAGRGTGVVFLATTLWSSTGFFYHLRRSGEMIYGCRRAKHGWKVRLSALFFTLCVLLYFAFAAGALFVAHLCATFLPAAVFYPALYLLALALCFFAAWMLNGYISPYRVKPSSTAAGSFFTALAWILASAAFTLYLRFSDKEKLYGALTVLVVFLLWLYWLMLCFVSGAIFNRVRMRGKKREQKRL